MQKNIIRFYFKISGLFFKTLEFSILTSKISKIKLNSIRLKFKIKKHTSAHITNMDEDRMEDMMRSRKRGCCGINRSHLKVVMLKDRLILRRRRACCIGLLFAPPLFFFLATLQYILIDTNKISGELMTNNFFYSTTIS